VADVIDLTAYPITLLGDSGLVNERRCHNCRRPFTGQYSRCEECRQRRREYDRRSRAKRGKQPPCRSCAGLTWRVPGRIKCPRCGLRYQAQPPVRAEGCARSNWSFE
jgi:hypothetical protein